MKFSAEISIRGVNPYVLVSQERAESLQPGWRKPLPVVVRVNGQPTEAWHINMMPVGDGDFYLYLHEAVRKASGTQVGDVVSMEVSFDSNYESGPQAIPEWFTAALSENPVALASWDILPPSRQKEVARYLSHLKSPEAQAKNLARAIQMLSGKDGRFMGRTWRGGA